MTGSPGGDPQVVLVGRTGQSRRRLETAFSAAGFDVITADSGADCHRVIEQRDVDGIVSEYDLPDLNGIRLLRSVRISRPTLPFVLVPESGSGALASDAIATGVSGFVPGDADPETVVDRFQESLERAGPPVDGESHERYRHLVEISPAPINVFDETGESIWGNRAVLDLLGLDSRDELIGRNIFEFIHPDDHDIARREVETVVEDKESVGPTRMRLLPPDGDVRHILVSTAVGRFLGTDVGQAVVVDVTRLQDVETELRNAHRLIENALDALEDVFYVVDRSARLLQWNERALEVTAYTAAQLEGRKIETLFEEHDRERVLASVQRVIDEGHDAIEANLRTRDGQTIPYQFRGRRFRTDEGTVRVVGIGRDVSERKERERQLKVLETWLRHNIRNDLTVIRGFAEQIRRGDRDDVEASARRIQTFADRLVEQADKERDLVNMLVSPPEPVTLDVADTVEDEVERLCETYPSAEIEVSRLDEFDVRAIPRIGDAIGELVENAVEHSDADTPRVSIEIIRTEPDRGEIRIADNGPGIPEMERETLLLDRDIDPLNHGSGLGLLVVYWILRISGGEVTFAENDPRGSVVTLSLRLA